LEAKFPLDARVTPVKVLYNSAFKPFDQTREHHNKKRSVLILFGKRSLLILFGKMLLVRE
jgi:hypothetical protein